MSTKILGPAGVQVNNINSYCEVGRVGTGAEETIPHGLGVTPFMKIVQVDDESTATANFSTAADATNIYVTVTNGKTYSVWALVARQ